LGKGVCRVAEVALKPLTCKGRGSLVGGQGRNGGLGALLMGSRKRGRYFEPAMSSSRRVIPLLNAYTGMALKVAIQTLRRATSFSYTRDHTPAACSAPYSTRPPT